MAVGYQVRLAIINRIISNRATIAFVDVSIKALFTDWSWR
jgi:hypothetical protein